MSDTLGETRRRYERLDQSIVKDSWRRLVPNKKELLKDAVAGIPGAVGSVPDGMAASVLAGVNPIHGLYASFAGPIAGGLTSSTQFMVITTTSAAALAAGSAIASVPSSQRAAAMILLTAIAGVAMIAAGVFKLGRYARFVSYSVMRGFLAGVAINIILGQLPDLTGAPSHGALAIDKAWGVITHPHSVDVHTLVIGALAGVILLSTSRTRFSSFAALIALIVPTLMAVLLHWDEVKRVSSKGPIPAGLPLPGLPHLSMFTPSLFGGALAVAAVVLVQGVGVGEAVPNPDGTATNVNQDFIAEGVGNLASALFRGQPVGGSVGQTALNRTAGARTRWAAIFSGLWMVAILVAFSPAISRVALTTLAAVLIVAAVSSLSPGEILNTWRAGPNSQIALVSTFVATLFLPIPAAVGLGVVISLLLQLNREAMDLRVVQLRLNADGSFDEATVPSVLPSDAVTVLDVYGSLLYAGSRTLQVRLPELQGFSHGALVLRLRGRAQLGNTFLHVIEDYATRLATCDGRLFLSGVSDDLSEQLDRSGVLTRAPIEVVASTTRIGKSSREAVDRAEAWLDGDN